MSYPINRRPLPSIQLELNRLSQNMNNRNLAQNALEPNYPTQAKSTQTKSSEAHPIEDKASSQVKLELTQLLRHDLLNLSQKSSFRNLTALLNVILTDKFPNMLRYIPKSNEVESFHSSNLFSVSNFTNNFFTMDDIVTFVAQGRLTEPGKEKELVEYLIEVSTPEQTDSWSDKSLYKLTPATKSMLHEIDLEIPPSMLEEIATLLKEMQKNPQAVSDHLKNQLLQKLKDTEQFKKEETDEFDFNYMEISEVSN